MQHKVTHFLRLIEEACSPEAEEFYEKYSRIGMFCVLASYYTIKGRIEKAQRQRPTQNDALNQARQLLQDARRIDFSEQLPLMGLAQLSIAQVEQSF